MYQKTIENFAKQFEWEPEIKEADKLKSAKRFVVIGMGGSHLAAGLLKIYNPMLDLFVHKDYGLPPLSDEILKESLFIASSYSGNTEEVLDFIERAQELGLHIAAISTNGKLLEFAQSNNIPYIQMPDTGIQPRNALGFSLVALAKLIADEPLLAQLAQLSKQLDPLRWEEQGKDLADKLSGKVPVIYSSTPNIPIAYNWKIKFNETGKIPAFYNLFPELNHNEMAGFDVIPSTKKLSDNFHFIFLQDENDHPKIKKRMEICKQLYEERNLPVTVLELAGNTVFEKIFNSLLLADWTALHTAKLYGAEPEEVKIIEEFKQKISK